MALKYRLKLPYRQEQTHYREQLQTGDTARH